MSTLHEALRSLGPLDFSDTPLDDLEPFLSSAFSNAQLIVDSVPIPAPSDDTSATSTPQNRSRSNTTSSIASSASEISSSSARSAPPSSDVEALQKEWKPVKMGAKENPLGMNVFKLGGKDGKGAWFARRSVHEGLGFAKWKMGLEREFPESMKTKGGPGEGNIRGIGGEKRVAYKKVEGVGKMEVYLLSAQFPGPTAPRDFVTMFLTSDQAISSNSGEEVPRHFMVVSKPCTHSDTPPREGYIRGQYESVEFIREIPINKGPIKSASATNLLSQNTSQTRNRSGSMLGREAIVRNAKKNHPEGEGNGNTDQIDSSVSEADLSRSDSGRARGKTISFDKSRGSDAKGEDMDIPREADESEMNPIEWIMITRSDPGGSVPRFMIERGTPGGIVSDASKFLNWACAKDLDGFVSDDEDGDSESRDEDEDGDGDGEGEEKSHKHARKHNHEKDLHNWQTNGHLAGIEEAETPTQEKQFETLEHNTTHTNSNGSGIYAIVAGAAGVAGEIIASHTPQVITNHLPSQITLGPNGTSRRSSTSSISSTCSEESFASALEGPSSSTKNLDRTADDNSSTLTTNSHSSTALRQDKELQKLEDKKKKLDEKLSKAREKEISKKSEDSAKEEEALRKVAERHDREIKKQEEKYQREVQKLREKREKEEKKAEEKRKKNVERDEKVKLLRELEEVRAEVGVLRKERELLRGQVGELQRENTALVVRIGRLGGEDTLRSVREEVAGGAGKGGRMRASSLKGTVRPLSFSVGRTSSGLGEIFGGSGERPTSAGTGESGEKEKENVHTAGGTMLRYE